MFGKFYNERDRSVAGDPGTLALSTGAYACLVLAELLERTQALSAARAMPDDGEDYSLLARTVDLFLLDADEARARGLRARLFCRDASGALDAWSVDPTDTLEDLGGELVPVDRTGTL